MIRRLSWKPLAPPRSQIKIRYVLQSKRLLWRTIDWPLWFWLPVPQPLLDCRSEADNNKSSNVLTITRLPVVSLLTWAGSGVCFQATALNWTVISANEISMLILSTTHFHFCCFESCCHLANVAFFEKGRFIRAYRSINISTFDAMLIHHGRSLSQNTNTKVSLS